MRSLLPLALLALTPLTLRAAAGDATASTPSPCTKIAADCTEWVTLGGGPSRSMIYRTFPLNVRNASIHRALIMIHGTNRNADHYFSTATGAAFLAGALNDAVVISPSFPSSFLPYYYKPK